MCVQVGGDNSSAATTELWSHTFMSCSSGFGRLDDHPFVVVEGAPASFDMVSFATGVLRLGDGDDGAPPSRPPSCILSLVSLTRALSRALSRARALASLGRIGDCRSPGLL